MEMQWLASEAKQIHQIFSAMFYSTVVLLLALGVVLNFFKLSVGQVPEFMNLVGRAVLAAFILAAFPEIMNHMADVTDQIAREIGQLNNLKVVVAKLGEKIQTLTFSWVSVKTSVLLVISYVSFFLLYVSVYVADAGYLLTWTLLYIFSPVLIAAFTLPSLSAATRGLFQSLVEVCLWKIAWSVLAALLWSFALSEINGPKYDVDFLTAIVVNVMLAFSLLLTPFVVRSLVKTGVAGAVASSSSVVLAAAALTPTGVMVKSKAGARKAANLVTSFGSGTDDDHDPTPPTRPVGPPKLKLVRNKL